MIGRKSRNTPEQEDVVSPQGFDDFTLRLGDMMRGERATLGKSLLDVQRELRIKASYIAAIENCDPSAFDTPGFIAGYVRSYARYLGMDPDETFAVFCAESGFSVAHGMSDKASTIRKSDDEASGPRARDPLAEPNMPFAPAAESVLSRIEPGAVGSTLVLLALIGGIGYGGWAVLQEVQRVQVTPIEQTPIVLSELDPLDGAVRPVQSPDGPAEQEEVAGLFTPPAKDGFDRLYRPQALDVPVLVARDAPISTLDPSNVGLFAQSDRRDLPQVQDSSLAAAALEQGLTTTALAAAEQAPVLQGDGVTVVAVRPAWVRVRDEAGTTLFTGIMNAGDTYAVPANATVPRIEVGESGAVYYAVNGVTLGPSGPNGQFSEVDLVPDVLVERYDVAAIDADSDLSRVLASLDLRPEQPVVAEVQAPVIAQIAGPDVTRPPEVPARPNAPERVAPILAEAPAAPQAPVAPVLNRTQLADTAVPASPQVLRNPLPGITVVATAETWVEVTSPSGKKLFAQTLRPGDTYRVPQTEQPPTIFSGNAGGVFFAVNGQTYGPYGKSGQFGRNLALSAEGITQKLAVADLNQQPALAKVVAELNAGQALPQE
ncbi:helix-turn-helix domain-containing protein [Thalassococcus lentus]|uniref:DUF4115 domain-containing protein n=1 Tax=Thalassococcus lentus TaxID=1210524 RepID=A0ABT4XQD1_9RHOB|nr:helix-turn-helix domain-containing protein [Thalassococcus lentus]MDA7424150.1 DUF4115 domain-containing protein [Thalassococcus lentus]